jgi:hypothetical protein
MGSSTVPSPTVRDPDGTPAAEPGEERYFQEIESRFAQLRGSPLLLSPQDWALVSRWYRMRIPLRIVFEALESVFASRRAEAGGQRPVHSLSYCRHAVEGAFEAWKESQLGGRSAPVKSPHQPGPAQAAAYVSARADDLRLVAGGAAPRAMALRRAIAALDSLGARLLAEEAPTLAAAEEELEGIENDLLDGLWTAMEPAGRARLEAAIRRDMEPLHARLTARALETTLLGYRRSRTQASEGVPRLTLYQL